MERIETTRIAQVADLVEACGDELEVRQYDRKTPLEIEEKPLGSLTNVRPGDAIVCFNKRRIYAAAREVRSIRGCLENALSLLLDWRCWT